jgi:hypothetical protein
VIVRRLSVLILVVASLMAGSALSASAATSPDTWATKFCTAFTKWQKTITSESSKANNALDVTSGADLSAIRAEFVNFLASDVAATKAVVKSIDSAGAPDVTNGSKIQSKILAGFRSTSDVFSGARSDAAALSTTDATSFVTDATKIETNLNGATDGFTAAFGAAQTLDKNNQLGAALTKAKACKAIASS